MLLNWGVGEDLRVPWIARRSNQPILKGISPEYSLEGLMLKLKLQYFGHLIWRTNSLEKHLKKKKKRRKRPWCWERLKAGGEGDDRGWDVGWHHRLNAHESEQVPGVGGGQGSLACCNPWVCKQSDMTEQLNWTDTCIYSFLDFLPI